MHAFSLGRREGSKGLQANLLEPGNRPSQVAGTLLPDAAEKLELVGPKLPTWPFGSAPSWKPSCETSNGGPPLSQVCAERPEFHL